MFPVTLPYSVEFVKYFSRWILRKCLSRISLWIHVFPSWWFLNHLPSNPSRFLASQMSVGMQLMGDNGKSSFSTSLVVAEFKLEFLRKMSKPCSHQENFLNIKEVWFLWVMQMHWGILFQIILMGWYVWTHLVTSVISQDFNKSSCMSPNLLSFSIVLCIVQCFVQICIF